MNNRSLEVSMFQYLDSIIDEFLELVTEKAATLAADHLFSVRDADEAKYLPEKDVAFHHTTAQLLFLSSRARRDTQTAVSFLTTRVRNHTKTTGENFKER